MRITCPNCSAPIEVAAPAGPAAEPLVVEGSTVAEVRVPVPSQVRPGQRLGRLELIERVGSGSFGEVWKARDTELGRLVAVKVPHPGQVAPRDWERFVREGRSAAQLRHPNIVAVHEAGESEGVPFLVCDFIDGVTLADVLAGRRLTFAEVAALLAQVADAADHAHRAGVVHRDVKPSNIMLEREAVAEAGTATLGRPLLMDFGLALRRDVDGTLTFAGQVLGTPAYMSPELAAGRGHEVDGRSDVYSLGVVLYQLLTGDLPFRGSSRMLLDQVLHEEPRPPRRLNDAIPADLQTITLACLAKEPERRYQTAGELAADLRRWLAGETIRARPVGRPEQLWRWCRRRPQVAGLAAAVVILLIATAVGSSLAAVWLDRAAKEARQARRQEEEARRAAEITLADLHTARGVDAGDRGRPDQALLWFAHAVRLAETDPERQRYNRVRVRTWWQKAPLPVRAFPHPGQELLTLAFHPGGAHLLTLSRQDRCAVWDLDRETELKWVAERPLSAAAWDPAGEWLALGTPEGEVVVRAFPGGKVLERIAHRGRIEALAVSPKGRFLALAGATVRVWDCQARAFLPGEWAHPRPVVTLTFNECGDRLATGCLDGRARVFAVPSAVGAAPLFAPVPHAAEFRLAAVAPAALRQRVPPILLPDGRGLLTMTTAGVVWRDMTTGAPLHPVPFPNGEPQTLAVSGDGKRFVVGGYAGGQVWDVATARPLGAFLASRNFLTSACFGPDGTGLFTVSGDRTAQLWSLPAGRPEGPPLLHQAILTRAVCSPDGRLLATAQADGLVRVWAPPRGNPRDRRLRCDARPTFARLGPDGRTVLATGAGWRRGSLTTTRLFAVDTGLPAGIALEGDGPLTDAAVSPAGTIAATLHSSTTSDAERFARVVVPEGKAGCLQLWDWRKGKRLFAPVPMPSEPRGVAFSADGKRVAVICGGGQVRVIDPATGRVVVRSEHGFHHSSHNTYPAVRFTPDGTGLVSWGPDERVMVWDAATGRPRLDALRHEGIVQHASLSADGRLLATAARDNTARVWNLTTGKQVAAALAHPDWVFTARFSPDGRHVLTACRDGMARLWDYGAGRVVCPPLKHADEVFNAAFSPDGRWVLTSSRDGTARLWEWHTGKPVTPALPLGGWGWSADFTAAGDYAIVAGEAPVVRAFHLGDLTAADDLDAEDLCLLGEVLSGQRIQSSSDAAPLTTEEWLSRWQTFRRRHPHHPLLEPPDALTWHRGRAAAFEDAGRRRPALWHLDRLLAVRPEEGDLYRRRARAHAALGQQEQAAADHARALDRDDKDWQACLECAEAHAALGRWDRAAADYARTVERGATAPRVLCHHALLRLAVGDRAGYRRACARLVAEFGATDNLKVANNVAWTCSYAPGAVDDPARVVQLAERAAAGHPNQYVTRNTLAATLYRAGRFKDAVRQLRIAEKAHPRGGAVFDFLFMAMCHQRLGDAAEARRWLGRAARWVKEAEEGKIDDPSLRLPLFWIQRLELELLRREAEGLIKGGKP